MTLYLPGLKPCLMSLCLFIPFAHFIISPPLPAHALTASAGEPARGNLINGIQFPAQLINCKLKNKDFSYTTPEVIAGLLDAFESFEKRYPESCDIYIGDFSSRSGGRLRGHGSHQNGRDVDIGLFVTENIPLNGFDRSTIGKLDIAKTWHLVQCIINTGRVECIYLDREIKAKLYRHAMSEGVDSDNLTKIFKETAPGGDSECIIRHEPGHRTHMHVRFLAPLSDLAASLKRDDSRERVRVETAQLSCLPQRFYHFATDNEKNLDQLAQNLGVTFRNLCKWNGLTGHETPIPGERVVFYKRGTDPAQVFSKLERHKNDPLSGSLFLASSSHGKPSGFHRPLRARASHLIAGPVSGTDELGGKGANSPSPDGSLAMQTGGWSELSFFLFHSFHNPG